MIKKACLLLLTLAFTAFAATAQDIITLTSGTQIQSKVLEINPTDIKYKDYNNLDGPVITIQKSTVSEIQYANGIKTVFNGGSSNNAKGNTEVYSSSGNYKREPDRNHGYKKSSDKNSRIHGWFFGLGVHLGISGATNSDPSYSTAGAGYSGGNILATKMFNQHIGIQFGIGSESYAYEVDYSPTSSSYYATDVYTLNCLTLPLRAVYFSNSTHRAGLYAMAGFDLSFLANARDEEGDNLTSYYNTVLISPYISSGVEFRNRYARGVWMFGLYYKTTLSNFYSGQPDVTGILAPGNTGVLNSAGLAINYMGKFGRGR